MDTREFGFSNKFGMYIFICLILTPSIDLEFLEGKIFIISLFFFAWFPGHNKCSKYLLNESIPYAH